MAATISIPPGFPDATTAGVPAGTVLSAYTGPTTITKAGTVIENMTIDDGLIINAPNVTIKNCIITGGYYFGVDGEKGGSTLLIQNCTIIGPGTTGEGNSGILGTATFIGNDISGYENGIMTTGGSGGVISGNYIHDITSSKPDAHYTGIQVEGGESNLRIENNTVMNDRDSNIFLQALNGPISNVVINHNYVGGGTGDNSYNIYVESRFGYPITNVSVTNNYIDKGYWGYFSIVNSSPTMSGNVEFDTVDGIFPPTGGPSTPPTGPTPPSPPVIASFSQDSGVVGDHTTNDNTLTLTGSALANSTVKVFADGTNQIGTVTADSSGHWTLPATTALSDGPHNLTATATNSSGQTSAASAALAVTVDTVAPAAPVVVSDSVVNTNHVLVSGTAAANSSIAVYDGNTVVGTGTTNSSGDWIVTTSALSNGAHALTAKATDVAGNAGVASEAFGPVIGATPTPPTSPGTPKIVSFSQDSGTVGDDITNDNTLTLSGTAVANSTVKVFDGSTQVGTATANSSGAWTLTTTALVDGSHALTATATTTSSSGTSPALFEDFNPWSGTVSPDGIWRIAGTWTGTGGDTLQPGNVKFTNTYPGETDTGFMSLTTPAGSPLRGAELQSLTTPGYSYGYYEVRMETANVKNGGVASFFWVEQPNYGSHEWDVEFTLSDSWAGTTNPGRVVFTTHPLDNGQWVNLDFNPSQAFHDYGFLWTPGRIDFTVDGEIVHTVIDPNLKTDATGYIMMNTWSSGNPNFGSGPPAQDATSVYDWVKFYPNATSLPAEDGSTGGTSSASAPLSVTVDTKAPTAPVLKANSVVDTNHVLLSGTAEAGSAIKVYDGSNVVGTGTVGANGSWSVTTSGLSNGTHDLIAKATDAAGNVSAASQPFDPVIGGGSTTPPTTTPSGLTGLVQVGNNYFLGSNGPELKYGGTAVTTGQFQDWIPISSVQVDGGAYDVAWKNSSGQFTFWATDSQGNFQSYPTHGIALTANSTTVESYETIFQQDLNGDHTIGIPGTTTTPTIPTTPASAVNFSSLTENSSNVVTVKGSADAFSQVGDHTFGIPGTTTTPTSPTPPTTPASAVNFSSLTENSSNVVTIKGTADAFNQVKMYDAKAYMGTTTAGADSTWSFTSSSAVSNTVHKFNAVEVDSAGHTTASSGSAILGSTGSNTLTSTSGNDLFVGNGHPDTFVFAANFGQDVIKDLHTGWRGGDTIQFSKGVFDSYASVLSHASQVGQDVVIATAGDTLTLKNIKLGALNSHDFHFA